MDGLSSVLGVPPSELRVPANSTVDLEKELEEFIKQSYESKENDYDALLDSLKVLEKKNDKIKYSINELLPKLSNDLLEFNNQLTTFTNDLGYIKDKSTELKNLLDLNSQKLVNINPLVNDLMISPDIITQIITGKINREWQNNIKYIREKRNLYKKYMDENKSDDLQVPIDFDKLCIVLDDLEKVILERTKKFIVHKIKTLRHHTPIPSQRVQAAMFCVKDIFQFIVDKNYSLALELRQAYSYTMRWYYKTYFARYIRSLTILPFKNIDSQYALGNGLSDTSVTNSTASYLFPTYLANSYTKSLNFINDEAIANYFQIDKRLLILTQEDNTVMVSQIAENNKMENFIEIGFKNLNLAILDNCSTEYIFLNKFFRTNSNRQELDGVLEQIYQPTFQEGLDYTKYLIENTYDIFGILISIRIGQQLQEEARKRKTPIIEDYINSQLIQLWPKFQQLVDFQCESLRKTAITTNIAKEFKAANNANDLTAPHELTVQFSQFLTSFLTLTSTHNSNIDERSEPVYNSITRLRNDFETVMTKCSKKTKSPERFLATNYLYLYNVLQQKILKMDHDGDRNLLPLILRETEEHYSLLVRAFSEKQSA